MLPLPEIGALIRCCGPSYDAGSVTYSGHERIHLPTRHSAGKILPGLLGTYQLFDQSGEWIYRSVPLSD